MELNGNYFINPAHLEIAKARYFLKDENGKLLENDIDEVFVRETNYIYQNDTDENKQEALKYRREKKIIPAGRMLAQAGTGVKNLCNCFLIGFDDDTREAISELKRKHFHIQANGGGVGMNFSTLRPRGSVCKTNQSRSSGAVGYIGDISYQSSNVQQGGNRSGANLGLLEDWHPDLLEFITKKSSSNWENIKKFASIVDDEAFQFFQWNNPYQWQMFNVSVLLTDAFMQRVINKDNSPWVLRWKDKEWHLWDYNNNGRILTVTAPNEDMAFYKASSIIPYFNSQNMKLVKGPYDMSASEWFDMICKNAHEDGCPGIMFIDTARKFHNGEYFNTICGANPCVTGDTWILTSDGPQQVKNLIGKQFSAVVDGKEYKCPNGFFETGIKDVVKIETSEGFNISVTKCHKILTQLGKDRVWKTASEICKGDLLVLNNHRGIQIKWATPKDNDFEKGYLLGHIIGDGFISHNRKTDTLCGTCEVWNEKDYDGAEIKNIILQCVQKLGIKHRSDFRFWHYLKPGDSYVMKLTYLYDLLKEFDIKQDKIVTNKIEEASYSFYQGFIRAFFDADGSVQGNHNKGISIRLNQSNKNRLLAVQRMLARIGIISAVYKRRDAGLRLLPDGHRGKKEYYVKDNYELIISNDNMKLFNDLIGFTHRPKQERLNKLLAGYSRKQNKEAFVASVSAIIPDAIQMVYDATVEDIHAFDANGLYVHNCAEILLPKNSVCCLSSICLPSFFNKNGEFDWDDFKRAVRAAVRGLDNVISLTKIGEKDIDANIINERRIGLGTTGIAELLILEKKKYSSEIGREYVAKILEVFRDTAYEASIELAKERGAFPAFNFDGFSLSEFFKTLPEQIKNNIKAFGIRNVNILCQAPAGTTGTMLGLSQGCEPYFLMCFVRNSRVGSFMDGSPAFGKWLKKNKIDFKEYNYSLKELRKSFKVPEYFEESHDISGSDHIKMQAVFAKYIDQGVSKTANMPADATVEDVKNTYIEAYKMGIKSTTIYRYGSKQQILESGEKAIEKRPEHILMASSPKRPEELPCDIHTTVVRGEKWTVLVGLLNNKPYEVFAAPQESFEISAKYKKGKIIKNGGGAYHLDMEDFKIKNISNHLKNDEHRVITRLISTCLRHGVPMSFITDQLAKADGTVVDFSKAILRVLNKYGNEESIPAKGKTACSNCGGTNIIFMNGCSECLTCNHSKCA